MADHPQGEQWVRTTIVAMRRVGARIDEIAAVVTFGVATVSRVLIESGLRSKTHGVRKPRNEIGGHKRACIKCGKVDRVRSDRIGTRHCGVCGLKGALGREPPNKGSTERQLLRTCKTCGAHFSVATSRILQRPRYRWATFCSKECYGIDMRTPGSRYSEVGKNYPSRNKGRRL